VTGDWRKLYNEELRNLYSLPNIWRDQIKADDMGGSCSTHLNDETFT
jgi:hypothetical protein